MSVSRQTDERLRSWLDGNQTDRERMCIALLSLNRRYSEIKPRRPSGGPDGARDIEATIDGETRVWGAVGFQNSVSDSSRNKREAKRKFLSDLKAALKGNPKLKGFVFFTNVDLTPTQQNELILAAKKLGLRFVEVFHRERIRILLDGPEGLGLRFQYLSISLSEAEQAAFFSRFGSQMEDLLSSRFKAVEQQLAGIEFLHRAREPLTSIGFSLRLKRKIPTESLGHFRVSILIVDPRRSPNDTGALVINCRDNSLMLEMRDGGTAHLPATDMCLYTEEPKKLLFRDIMIAARQSTKEISFGLTLNQPIFLETLGDFQGKWVNVFLSSSLLSKTRHFSLTVNEHELISSALDELFVWPEDKFNQTFGFPVPWDLHLSKSEKKIKWALICPKSRGRQRARQLPADSFWIIDFRKHRPPLAQRAIVSEESLKVGERPLMSRRAKGVGFEHEI